MSMQPTTSELEDFYRYLGKHLENGGADLSPEEVLAMWRDRAESIEAIKEGLEDVKAGRVTPLEEFDREFRTKHGIQRNS